MKLPAQQLEQEARRILRRLAAPRQALLARSDNRFAVARGPAGLKASRVTVAADQHRLMEDKIIGAGDAARPESAVNVRVNAGESPLARLKFRDLVDDMQFAAGEKLRRDFTLGQLTPRMGVDLTAPVMGGGGARDTISDVALAARQRFNRAMTAVGPGLSDLLFDVCCHLTALESAEMRRGWAKRSGRVVLKIALDRLAAHYGLDVVARGGIRRWSAETGEAG